MQLNRPLRRQSVSFDVAAALGQQAEALQSGHEASRLDVLVTDFHLGNNQTAVQVLQSSRASRGVH